MMTPFEDYIRAWTERAWNGSLDEGRAAIYELMREDCELEGVGADIPCLVGPAAYEPLWRELRTAFPDLRAELLEVLPAADGQSGTAWFRMRGHHGAPFLGKQATERPIDVSGVASVWLDGEGRARRIRNTFDAMTLLVQIDHAVESVRAASQGVKEAAARGAFAQPGSG